MDDITNAHHIRQSHGSSGVGWVIGGVVLLLVLLFIVFAGTGGDPDGATAPDAAGATSSTGAVENSEGTIETAPAPTAAGE